MNAPIVCQNHTNQVERFEAISN